jgi:hypothetical protein
MSFGAVALFAGVGLWLRSISILLFSVILFFDISLRSSAHRGAWPGKAIRRELRGLQACGGEMASKTERHEAPKRPRRFGQVRLNRVHWVFAAAFIRMWLAD